MTASGVMLSANDSTPLANLGQTYVDFDLEKLFGPRAYVYVRNQSSTDWTKGLAVRQRSDLFATEGTALTPDANTVVAMIKDATTPGAPWTTDRYIPDTLKHGALYHHASHSTTANYAGRLWSSRGGDTNEAWNIATDSLPDAAITNSGAYIVWAPYAFILTTNSDVLAVGGITQSNISGGYHGWVQFGGFMYAMLDGDTDEENVNGAGNIPCTTLGFGSGVTVATNDGLVYSYNLKDNAAASAYSPVMAACPYMRSVRC